MDTSTANRGFQRDGVAPLPSAPSAVRRQIACHLADLDPEVVADVQLVASELVTNAVVHGDGDLTVRVEPATEAVTIEVIDHGTGVGPQSRDDGRGLEIVERLSSRWGIERREGSTIAWSEVPLRSPQGSEALAQQA